MFHLFTLVSFIALYISAVSFGFLAFQFIERLFPDALSYSSYSYYVSSALVSHMGRSAIAGLIVAFPLYVFLMRLIWKETKGNEQNLRSGVRKWFIYITLVGVAAVVLGDLIAVVSHALGGELAIRFLLKAFTIFMIAGSIFAYYLHDLQRKAEDSFSHIAKAGMVLIMVLVIVFIGYGVAVIGSPGKQRAFQFDRRRISDVQSISYAIDSYWKRNKKLPAHVDDFKNQGYYYIQSVIDPQTALPYEYRIVGDKSYELCTVFQTDSSKTASRFKTQVPFSDQSWSHAVGRTCFKKEVQDFERGVDDAKIF